MVSGPAEAPVILANTVTNMGNGVYTAKYTPNKPGLYTVRVRSNGKPINGSPFTCRVRGQNGPLLTPLYGMLCMTGTRRIVMPL